MRRSYSEADQGELHCVELKPKVAAFGFENKKLKIDLSGKNTELNAVLYQDKYYTDDGNLVFQQTK